MELQKHMTSLTTLYAEHGIKALSKVWLKDNGHPYLYQRLDHYKPFSEIVSSLDLTDDLAEYQHAQRCRTRLWTKEHVDRVTKTLITDHGCIPTIAWLHDNGFGAFDQAARKLYGSFNAYRKAYDQIDTRRVSRDGQIWMSFPEACFANHLWARGINIEKGGKYPVEYEEMSGRAGGWYDCAFIATVGEFATKPIKVEIWGNAPHGASERYTETRGFKEAFNQDDPLFIGIEYQDCFCESKLEDTLLPFIGIVEPYKIANENDREFKPVQWALVDEVLRMAKVYTDNVPGGKIPSIAWFDRRSTYKGRPVAKWEPVNGWATFSHYVTKIGGIPKLRQTLGQSDSNYNSWSKDTVVREVANFFIKHKAWPSPVMQRLYKKTKNKTIDPDEVEIHKEAVDLVNASKYRCGSINSAVIAATQLLPVDIRATVPRVVQHSKKSK